MKTEKVASSREIVFVNTLKFTANTMMAMLFMVLTLTSCSSESINNHPTAATGLMADSASQRGLGWHLFTVKASATDINGNSISANAEVRYDADRVVYVENEEELGLPISATTPDGQTFYTNDKNTIRRTENHSADGVNLNVAGGEFRYGALGARLNDTTQVCYAYIADQSFATANLPESFSKEWRGEKVSVVEYHRIWKKAAPAPAEVNYRKVLTIDWSDTRGAVYAEMVTEKTQGESVIERAAHYDMMAQWGVYNPQVSSISVLSTEFRNEDIAGVNAFSAEKDAAKTGLGDGGKYTRRCVRHTNETFSDVFTSTPDADGNTDRPVRCNLDVWVYTYTCVLSDGHEETFEVEFSISSVKNEVDPTTNVYERIIEVKVNGQVVDTMNGKVSLVIG